MNTLTRELQIIRFSLLLIPAMLTVYVYDYSDYSLFTFYFLLQLLLATAGTRLPGRLPVLAVILELLYSAWMCREYGLLMLFPAISALLCYSRLLPGSIPILLAGLQLGALNVAFSGSDSSELICVNLTFLLVAALDRLLLRAGRGREDTLFLYDELRKNTSSSMKPATGCCSSLPRWRTWPRQRSGYGSHGSCMMISATG